MPTHYEILEIQSSADVAEVKRAFHRLALVYHPDKGSNSETEKYSKISLAFKILSDSEARKKYDKQLLNPNDSDLVINISQQQRYSHTASSSTALVPVTSYNLSELIAISALPSDIILKNLKK